MNLVGFIPARGGSKGIPNKNLISLSGKPLLSYTAEAALESRVLSRVVLSTDSEQIANTGRSYGLEVPFLRPAHLAADETPVLDVLQHFLSLDASVDAVVLLQPTSPFRNSEHIHQAVEIFLAKKPQSLVSVVRVPHSFNPVSVLKKNADDSLEPWMQTGAAPIFRRQDKPEAFARNGPAILISTAFLIRSGVLYGSPNLAYEMDARSSLDIDSLEDLQMAEYFISR